MKVLLAGMIIIVAMSFSSPVQWVPILQESGFSVQSLGYVWSLMALASLISGIISHGVLKKGNERKFIMVSLVLRMAAIFFVLFTYGMFSAVLVLCLITLFQDVLWPAQRSFFHSLVPSKIRATVSSFEAMIDSFAIVLAMPLGGFLVDVIGARYTVILGGLFLFPALWLYYSMKK